MVARVGEAVIDRKAVEAALRRAGARPAAAEIVPRLQAEALESLVEEQLLREELKRAEIEIGPEEVDKAFEEMRVQVAARGLSLEQFLDRMGRSEEEMRGRIAFDLGLKRLLTPRLTPAAMEATFARHRRDLDGTLVRASHIVLRPRSGAGGDGFTEMMQRADRIRRDVLRGSLSFADAARTYSAGPSRHRGGDVGGFPRRGVMVEEFAKQAFALAKGEMSRPFISPFGVHVVLVTAVQPGTRTLEDVRPQVEQLLVQQVLRSILEDARRRTPVEYAAGVPHFDPATLTGDPAGRRVVVEDGSATTPPATVPQAGG